MNNHPSVYAFQVVFVFKVENYSFQKLHFADAEINKKIFKTPFFMSKSAIGNLKKGLLSWHIENSQKKG